MAIIKLTRKLLEKINYILTHPKCDGCNIRKDQSELKVDGCGTPLLMCDPCWSSIN